MEEKTVKVQFNEEKKKSYSIQWSELLTPAEVPFETIYSNCYQAQMYWPLTTMVLVTYSIPQL